MCMNRRDEGRRVVDVVKLVGDVVICSYSINWLVLRYLYFASNSFDGYTNPYYCLQRSL